MAECNQSTDADLKAAIEDAGLGPVRHVEMFERDGLVVTHVELDPASPRKVRTLRRWAACLEVCDAINGRRDDRDPYTRLHVRGTYGHGQLVIVTCLFSRRTEVRQVATVADYIRHDPQILIDELTAGELVAAKAGRS